MEKKPLSKTAKIALGVTVSAIAVTAIAVPTAITLSKDGQTTPPSYSITISDNLTNTDDYNIVVKKGVKIKDLVANSREGYEFKGWFKDMACTNAFGENEVIDSDTTIFAKYEIKTLALSVDLPTGMSFRFLKTNGEQYTEEELSNIKYGTTMKFEISSDDQVEGTSYAYAVNYDGEEVPHIFTEGKYVYSVTLTKEAPIVLEGRFEYAVTTDENSNEQITIKNYKNYSESEKIVVPEKIANLPVAVIENLSGGDLSQENTVVTSISLPKTIQYIEPQHLGLFTNLTKLSISSQNPYLKNNQGVVYMESNDQTTILFCSRTAKIDNLKLPLNTVSIGARAFEDCTGVKSVNFEELTNLVSIGDFAFASSGVETAHLGESVTDIGYSAFNACQNLKSVRVEAHEVYLHGTMGQSEFFGSYNLYQQEGETYLAYTFSNCPNIEYVYWNANIFRISGTSTDSISLFNNSATNKGTIFVLGADTDCSIGFLSSSGSIYLTLNFPLKITELILNKCTYTTNPLEIETILLETENSLEFINNFLKFNNKIFYISEEALRIATEAGKDYADKLQDTLTLGSRTYQKVQSDREGYLMYTLVEEGE